jgi:hypothetical protein
MNPTKLVLHFSDFSVIFYAIYKKQGNGNTIGVTFLQERPWKEFDVCNVALGAAGRRGRRNSSEAGGLGRAGAGAGWSWGYGGAIWGFGPGGDAASDGRRRRTRAAAAGATAPARQRSRRGNLWWLLCALEDGLGRLIGRGS